MSRRHSLTLVAVTVLAVAATPALAAKGGGSGGGGKLQATIAFATVDGRTAAAPTAGSTVSFAVSSSLESRVLLVVTNRCWRDGQVVYNEYKQVTNGLAGPFTLSLTSPGAATCEAFVWAWPDSTTALKGGWMSYQLG